MVEILIFIGVYLMLLGFVVIRFKEVRKLKLERKQILYGHQYGSLQDQSNVSIKALKFLLFINILALMPFLIIKITQMEELIFIMSTIYIYLNTILAIMNIIVFIPWGFYLFSEIKHISINDSIWNEIQDIKEMKRYYRDISLTGIILTVSTIYQTYSILMYYKVLLFIGTIILICIVWCGMADMVLDEDYNNSVERTRLTPIKATMENIISFKRKEFRNKKIKVANENFYNIKEGIKNIWY
ncbi:hypothetical protein [Niameybacter massiliensis]|uniref:hypothetical protein n=1 Tax=Niameybacter massiliensis TaxID=1658108 RepID=UPI0006B4B9AD|nr:hypothetical protein [Niameybacter massiliensis]